MYEYLYPYFSGAFHAVYLSAFVLLPLMVVEMIAPAQKLNWSTVLFNWAYAPLFLAIQSIILFPLSLALAPYIPANVFGSSPQSWPVWQTALVVLGYLLSFDFFYYWLHRAQHHFPFLWRFHRFHHSDVSISAVSSFRHHWMEEVFRYFAIVIPLLVVFGRPEQAAPLLGLAMGGFGLFVHWNTRVDLGFLSGVVVGPRYHRVHHSIETAQINRNFATFFPVWDRIFGTQWLPREGDHPKTGVSEIRRPNNVLQLLPLPVRDT